VREHPPRGCLRKERQLEGIANAKARGVYKGRKASIDPAKIKKLKAEGLGPSAIAKALRIGRASVYRALTSERAQVPPPRLWSRKEFRRRSPRAGKNFELGPAIFVSIDKSDAARSPVPPHYMAAL
jgi:hypothetical protein